jgi:hypothetical protein
MYITRGVKFVGHVAPVGRKRKYVQVFYGKTEA